MQDHGRKVCGVTGRTANRLLLGFGNIINFLGVFEDAMDSRTGQRGMIGKAAYVPRNQGIYLGWEGRTPYSMKCVNSRR